MSASKRHAAGADPVARTALALFAAGVPLDVYVVPGARGPSASQDSVSVLLGFALAAATAWQVLRQRRVRAPDGTVLLLTAFTAWASLSILWALVPAATEGKIRTFAMLLVFVWMGWQITRSAVDVRWVAAGFLAGCSVAALLAWQAFLSGELLSEFDPRYVAPGFDPNDMGVTLSIGIPVAAHLALTGRSRWNAAWLAYVPLALSAVALSASRGATVTAVVAVLSVVVVVGRRNLVAGLGMMGMAVATASVAWIFVPMETWLRIFTLTEQVSGGNLSGRLPIWRAGTQILERHPVLGVGAGGFADAVSSVLNYRIVGHNAFLSVTVDLGLLGGVLFVGAVAWPLMTVLRVRGPGTSFVVSVLLTWTVGVSSLSWEYRKTTWLVLLVTASVAALDRAARSARRRDARAEDSTPWAPARDFA